MPMDFLFYPGEGARFVARRLRLAFGSPRRYAGNAEEICRHIVDDCWNGRYFITGEGNFRQFWTRDFSFCAEPLVNLGYGAKVVKTLDYAIDSFRRHRRVTTTLSIGGAPFDVYTYSPDSLPLLLRALRISGSRQLLHEYRDFLQEEIEKYIKIVIDAETGLVKMKPFSSIKDNSVRYSSMYDNSMAALLAKEAASLGLRNPLSGLDYNKILIDNFWEGGHFRDSLSGSDVISADANIFPYWTGVIRNKGMLRKSMKAIAEQGLDMPFPVKYTGRESSGNIHWLLKLVIPNYEGDSIWMHMGPLYIGLLEKVDPDRARRHLEKYKEVIEANGNYLEVFTPDGRIFKTLLYHSDEGMLWAAMYLDLVRRYKFLG
jgi:hypothetical protein